MVKIAFTSREKNLAKMISFHKNQNTEKHHSGSGMPGEIVAQTAAEIIPASPPFDHILAAVARNRVRPTPVFDNVFARPGRPRPLPRARLCPRHAALLRFRRSKGLQLANGPV